MTTNLNRSGVNSTNLGEEDANCIYDNINTRATVDTLQEDMRFEAFEKEDRRNGLLTVVGGISLMIYLGTFYLWGNIDIYVLSYFHEFNPSLSVGFIFIVDTLLITASTIGYNVSTFLLNSKRVHPKLIVACAGTFALIGVFGSSFTEKLAPYLTLYTLMNGIGCGCCYMVPLVCGWEYFPEKRGTVTGCILAAYGFSSFAFSLISTKLVNPDNV